MQIEEKCVGIITLGKNYLFTNYGTFFQHLALRKYVSELGFSCGRIPRRSDTTYERRVIWRVIRRIFSGLWHVVHTKVGAKEELRMVVCYIIQALHFENTYRCLLGDGGLDVKIDEFSNIIVGGDQVFGGTDDAQFGVGRRENCNIISYAVSGDWVQLSCDSEWMARADKELHHFAAIAVRERMGVELLDNNLHLDKRVVRVCDPVFLQPKEFYNDKVSAKNIFARPTLLFYLLNLREKKDFDLERYVSVADKLGVELKIVGIQGAERYIPFRYWCVPKPLDFIRMIRDADYVVTNSFHGVCFTLLFGKQFACLSQHEEANCSQNVRSKELLERLGLSACLLGADSSVDSIAHTLNSHLDYAKVDAVIESEREFSREWLKNTLK